MTAPHPNRDTLIELLTDIIAASRANDGGSLMNAIEAAHDTLSAAGLWNDNEAEDNGQFGVGA